LRRSRPDLHRPFKVPLVPWVPAAGGIFCLVLMISLPAITWYRFLAWLGIGLIIYANYGYHHSKAMKKKEQAEAGGDSQQAEGDDGMPDAGEPVVDVVETEGD
jgi:APA family basic amino acid/polyamine antiporter